MSFSFNVVTTIILPTKVNHLLPENNKPTWTIKASNKRQNKLIIKALHHSANSFRWTIAIRTRTNGLSVKKFQDFPRSETKVSSARNFCFTAKKLLFHAEETFYGLSLCKKG